MKVKLTERMVEIAEFFKDLGKCYFVGGCVRDLMLDIAPKDYDLITVKEPDEIESYIKGKGKRVYLVGKRFGTIGVKLNGEMIEITTYRKEIYDFKSRRPVVEYSKNLNEDLGRRDFTLNALVCDFKGNVKDYFGGMEDFYNACLRAGGNPRIRFKEDPLRILRAVRFAAKFKLNIESKTMLKLKECRWEMLRLSKERIVDEMSKILSLDEEQVMGALRMMFDLYLFQVIFPELHLQRDHSQDSPHHEFCLDKHTIKVVGEVVKDKRGIACVWAALLHDVGKPFTRSVHKSMDYCNYIDHHILGAEIAKRWMLDYKFSKKNIEFVVDTIKNHISDDCWLREYDVRGHK